MQKNNFEFNLENYFKTYTKYKEIKNLTRLNFNF